MAPLAASSEPPTQPARSGRSRSPTTKIRPQKFVRQNLNGKKFSSRYPRLNWLARDQGGLPPQPVAGKSETSLNAGGLSCQATGFDLLSGASFVATTSGAEMTSWI